MSRSYRAPWATDGYKGSIRKQYCKNQANKIIRRSEEVPNGKAYRKFYESWDICDYKFYINKDESRPWRYLRK